MITAPSVRNHAHHIEGHGEGQVTLRKELLDHLGVAPGDRIIVDVLPVGRVITLADLVRPKRRLSDLQRLEPA